MRGTSVHRKIGSAEGRRVDWMVHRGGRFILPQPQCNTANISVSTTQAGGRSPDLTSGANVVARSRSRSFLQQRYNCRPLIFDPQNPWMTFIVHMI